MNFERHRINPIEWMKGQGWPTDHLTYDPKMRKGEYSIIRGSTHDGTLMFVHELINKALSPLAAKASYYRPRKAEVDEATDIRYTVGPLRIASVFGMVDLPCGRYPGERQRVRIPVRTTLVK